MIQLHFNENQLNIGKSMGVLHLFVWNYVNYANMEGFRRDSHNYKPDAVRIGIANALELIFVAYIITLELNCDWIYENRP